MQVINNMKTWAKEVTFEPSEIMEKLVHQAVEYDLNPSARYILHLGISICELQQVDLNHFWDQKQGPVVFFLNLYNLLSYYLFLRFGSPETDFISQELTAKKAFLVGTNSFTLASIQNQILFSLDQPSESRGNHCVGAPPMVLFLLREMNWKAPLIFYEDSNFQQVMIDTVSAYMSSTIVCHENTVRPPDPSFAPSHCV